MARVEVMFTAPFACPNGIQATRQGIWCVDQESDDVFLLDETGRVLRRIRTESENGSGLSYGEGALWIGSNGPSSFRKRRPADRAGKYVLKVDPRSGATLEAHELQGPGGVHGVEYVDGTLWVGRPGAKIIQRYKLPEFKVICEIPSPFTRSHGLAWVEGALWCVYTNDRCIVKQDPQTGKVLDRIDIPEPNPEPHGLTYWKGQFIYCDAAHGPFDANYRAMQWVTFERGKFCRVTP